MLGFKLQSNLGLLVRSKLKFLLLGLIIFIMNTVFVFKFLNLAASGENPGDYMMVFAFINLPVYIISIILLMAPLLYHAYYKKTSYCFEGNSVVIERNGFWDEFMSTDIECIFVSSIGQSSNTVFIRFKDVSKLYQLEGIGEDCVLDLLKWSEMHQVNIERQ